MRIAEKRSFRSSNRSSSPALLNSSEEDLDEERKEAAHRSMIGGNSYLDESITPMKNSMKVEEMQNLNHTATTTNNDQSRILSRHLNGN